MRRYRCSGFRPSGALVAGTLALGLAATPRPTLAQGGSEAPPLRAARDLTDVLAVRNDECCVILLYPIGARRASLGEAVTSVASADAVFYNPAGLAELERNHFVLHHSTETEQINAFTLAFTPGNLATFALSYELADFGDQETGVGPVPTGRVSVRDHIVIASFATTLAPGVSAGLNYKFFNSRITCSGQCAEVPEVDAKTHGLDLGVQWRPVWLTAARVGASLLNLGFPLQYVNREQADPMPTRLRVGVSYDVMEHIDAEGPYQLWLLVDAEENDFQDAAAPTTSVAVELGVGDVVFLRGGYAGGEGLGAGPAVGVGIVYSGFNVSVAKRVSRGALGDDPFQLTLDVGF